MQKVQKGSIKSNGLWVCFGINFQNGKYIVYYSHGDGTYTIHVDTKRKLKIAEDAPIALPQ